MNRKSREAIKAVAERYGMDQGDVLDLVPILMTVAAERSLSDRRKKLGAISTLADQAARSLESIVSLAPHMRPVIDEVIGMVKDLPKMEEAAIASRDVYGLPYSVLERFRYFRELVEERDLWPGHFGHPNLPSPLLDTIKEAAKESGGGVTVREVTSEWFDGKLRHETEFVVTYPGPEADQNLFVGRSAPWSAFSAIVGGVDFDAIYDAMHSTDVAESDQEDAR
ncbi:hypothetical protein [Skermanella stibiiresistens]|nr:hypothetical protein [Skermanella stibiiresistens]